MLISSEAHQSRSTRRRHAEDGPSGCGRPRCGCPRQSNGKTLWMVGLLLVWMRKQVVLEAEEGSVIGKKMLEVEGRCELYVDTYVSHLVEAIAR